MKYHTINHHSYVVSPINKHALNNISTILPPMEGLMKYMTHNKIMTKAYLSFLAILLSIMLYGQDDAVLFTVENNPITVSEFKYIYEKNNRDNASYTKESLDEYLDLYINFKLKVQRAKDLGLHNNQAYKDELMGYRKQLADSYVIDREVIDQIVKELYERKKYDIKISHLLIPLKRKASVAETTVANEKLETVKKALKDGLSFEDAVSQFSEDMSSKNKGGDIGYITAALPNGYVELEHAAYSNKVGDVAGPVLTDLGYHFIKVTDKRAARGRMEAQHILIRDKKNGMPVSDAQSRIDTIHSILSRDVSKWDAMTKSLSEDQQSAKNNGGLGVFGISQYESIFEDAAFSLTEDGAISKPVKTSIGWHVIRRKAKKSPETMEQLKAMVKGQLNTGERFDIQKEKVVEQIKKEAKFQENPSALKQFRDSLDQSFFDYNWEAKDYPAKVLFTLGDKKFTLVDLAEYGKISSKTRMKATDNDIDKLVATLYSNFIQDKAIEYVEQRLEERYIDFRNLLREYEEGILLFEITKAEVWDKASQDTTGLKKYYNEHNDRYVWEPRADVTSYTVRSDDTKVIKPLLESIAYMSPEQVIAAYNKEKELVMYEALTVERSSEVVRGMSFSEGHISTPNINKGLRITTFSKIEKTYPASKKSLAESKGYVISDYQDVLEKEWITDLKKKYNVSINKKILKGLITKSGN